MIELNEEVTEEVTDSVEETTDENQEQPIEEVVEETIDESKFDSADNPDVIKIDLDKAPQVKQEDNITKVNIDEKSTEETVETEQPVMEEVTEQETQEVQEVVEEAIAESETTGKPLPEGVQKLVEFMNETGGDLNDYVKLNRDVKEMDDSDVLDEYYRSTKSHLTPEERSFLLEDNFGYDDSVDDEKQIRKKKIALKEQVAEARAYLDGQKSKYYEEIKAGSKLTDEQQEAINFYHKYNKDSENQKKLTEKSNRTFLNKTDSFFGQNFKGFEYNVGDKKYRFNVKDVDKVKKTQSDLNNFVNKFVGDDSTTIEDAEGYHKSLYTAMNADSIAKHFYEQGKADAIKERIAKDKNINLNPRQTHGEVNVGGIKVRALGESSSDMKNRSFKIRKKN
tara:strand:+ start:3718 stop:4899 length:1182 start_codon:yes stop_codon:yes gene_type:complete